MRVIASALGLVVTLTLDASASAADAMPKASLAELVTETLILATETNASRSRGPADASRVRAPFFDTSPHASIVARDWRGSVRVVGTRGATALDDVRPTASTRMVFGRVGLGSQLTTFAQLGVGEWRLDTAMFPHARGNAELAGQVGAGFDVELAREVHLAGEVQYTFLFRGRDHYTPDEVAPRSLAAVVALKASF